MNLKKKERKSAFYWATMTYISLLRPSSAFRARFTRPHSATRPNAARTTCSSPQNGTGKHCSCMGRAQWTRQDCFKQQNVHLDKAREGASPLRRCLAICDCSPMRRPPHPLQMCKSNLSTISLHRRSHAERRLGSHYTVRVLRSLSIPSAPEA